MSQDETSNKRYADSESIGLLHLDNLDRSRAEHKRAMALLRQGRCRQSSVFRSVAPLLCAHDVQFAKLPVPAVGPVLACLIGLKLVDERVDWTNVSDRRQQFWRDGGECEERLMAAMRCLAEPQEKIAVISHTSEHGLIARAGDVARLWHELHSSYRETVWIVARQPSDWLIEIAYSEQELVWARNPAAQQL